MAISQWLDVLEEKDDSLICWQTVRKMVFLGHSFLV